MDYREYGPRNGAAHSDRQVIVLHGGPGAPGSARGLAEPLADEFHVFEPFQRRRDDQPLTVMRHVDDLHQFIEAHCGGARPTVVGHSWGAMLALAHAAEHPDDAAGIALVGCGTFDLKARARFEQLRQERTASDYHEQLAKLEADYPDPQQRVKKWGELLRPIYAFDPIDTGGEAEDEAHDPATSFDEAGHRESWGDMVNQQAAGVYPAKFGRIRCRVAMFHGDYDPHPGQMIRDSLLGVLPQLEYHEFANCGHEPWTERQARDAFFAALRSWLASVLPSSSGIGGRGGGG